MYSRKGKREGKKKKDKKSQLKPVSLIGFLLLSSCQCHTNKGVVARRHQFSTPITGNKASNDFKSSLQNGK